MPEQYTRSEAFLRVFSVFVGVAMFGMGVYAHDWMLTIWMGGALIVTMLLLYRRIDHLSQEAPADPPKLSRRQQLRANGGSHTVAEWRLVCELNEWRCVDCGRKRPLTKDHIIPVDQGGRDDISNIQPLCRSCNSAKHARAMDFRRRP